MNAYGAKAHESLNASTFKPASDGSTFVGKGDKHRRLPLNAEARQALEAIQPVPPDYAVGPVFRGKRGPYTARAASLPALAISVNGCRIRTCVQIECRSRLVRLWTLERREDAVVQRVHAEAGAGNAQYY